MQLDQFWLFYCFCARLNPIV